MSAFGGTANLRGEFSENANKIRHFSNRLLPRKRHWEAHGKHGAQGLGMWKSSRLVRLSKQRKIRFAHCFDRKSRTAALNASGSRTGPSWLTFGRTICTAPGTHLLIASLIIT